MRDRFSLRRFLRRHGQVEDRAIRPFWEGEAPAEPFGLNRSSKTARRKPRPPELASRASDVLSATTPDGLFTREIEEGIRAAFPRAVASEALCERVARICLQQDASSHFRSRRRVARGRLVLAAAGLAGVAAIGVLWLAATGHNKAEIRRIVVDRSPIRASSSQPAPELPRRVTRHFWPRSIEGRGTRANVETRRLARSLPASLTDEGPSDRLPSGPTPARVPLARPTDDLSYLNGAPERSLSRWGLIPTGDAVRAVARLSRAIRGGDDFVSIPLSRIAAAGPAGDQAAARALAAYRREAAVVDARLFRKVTLGLKATALADLCERLQAETGIVLSAGQSVADEKVTLFCKEQPLRDVMRQLSRPFGYTWLRSGAPPSPPNTGAPPSPPNTGGVQEGYRYELAQDLRSQLLEEELRNRDRNAALLDVDREMGRYRRYLDLSPEQALARAQTAPPEEKEVLLHFAGKGWGPAQIYYRLSPNDLAALRAGESLTFSATPRRGEQSLPAEMTRFVLESLRDYRVTRRGDRFDAGPAKYVPDGQPPANVPEAKPFIVLKISRSELGQLTLQGFSGIGVGTPATGVQIMGDGERSLAIGLSPTVRNPKNAVANAKLARDPALQARVTVQPVGSGQWAVGMDKGPTNPPEPFAGNGQVPAKVTSAEVLEAIHRATGIPIVADYYTRLYPAQEVSVRGKSIFDAVSHVADTMRLRWDKDGEWLRFRGASYFQDRLKEVPNRLLVQWEASRREHGALTIEDMVEIAQLRDAQLNSNTMAEGARERFGLAEWDLARGEFLRPHWRLLAGFSREQRQQAQRPNGLPFAEMSLVQQQGFLSRALGARTELIHSLTELDGASLRVDYSVPGRFEWRLPEVPDNGTPGTPSPLRGLLPPPVREPTREAALLAARRIDSNATETRVLPTDLSVTLVYSLGGPKARLTPHVVHADRHNVISMAPRPVGAP